MVKHLTLNKRPCRWLAVSVCLLKSRAETDRAQLAKAIASLTPGDTLVICKLDWLARSTRDLLNTLAAIADKGAAFKSLGDSWADTTTPAGKLMLTVAPVKADNERKPRVFVSVGSPS